MTRRAVLAGEIRALLVRYRRIDTALRTGTARPGGNREAFRRYGPLESWALERLEGEIEWRVEAMGERRRAVPVGPQGVLGL